MNSQTLEDSIDDVIHKALMHYGKKASEMPSSPPERLMFLKNTLKLDLDACQNMPEHIPSVPLPSCLTRHVLPFHEWTVNIWTIETPLGIIAVDSGCSPDDMHRAMGGIKPSAILITHKDRDHIGGISAFPDTQIIDPEQLERDRKYTMRGLEWKIHDLAGHTNHSVGYETILEGHHVFFPGDSIFARSIGKSRMPIETTIANIVKTLNALPNETIICPGHGPATTVGDEKKSNPFLASFFRENG